jgi:hypothetical protein
MGNLWNRSSRALFGRMVFTKESSKLDNFLHKLVPPISSEGYDVCTEKSVFLISLVAHGSTQGKVVASRVLKYLNIVVSLCP